MPNAPKSLPKIEAALCAQQASIPAQLTTPLTFEVNVVRKGSDHRALCLTVLDAALQPVCVIKTPVKQTKLSVETLVHEYKVLTGLREGAKAPAAPEPWHMFVHEGRLIVVQGYVAHSEFAAMLQAGNPLDLAQVQKPLDALRQIQDQQGVSTQPISTEWIEKHIAIWLGSEDQWPQEWAPGIREVAETARQTAGNSGQGPIGLLHGDFSPFNIGTRTNGEPVIFDWEDAQEGLVGFDLFYWVLGVFWMTFFEESKLSKGYIDSQMDKLEAWASDEVTGFRDRWNVSESSFQLQWQLFILHQIGQELAEKRQSPSEQVQRWIDLKDVMTEADPIRAFLQSKRALLESFLSYNSDRGKEDT